MCRHPVVLSINALHFGHILYSLRIADTLASFVMENSVSFHRENCTHVAGACASMPQMKQNQNPQSQRTSGFVPEYLTTRSHPFGFVHQLKWGSRSMKLRGGGNGSAAGQASGAHASDDCQDR